MNSDVNGCSTCPLGEEHFETFTHRNHEYVQYDYRALDGELFSRVRPSLEQCRKERDEWLRSREV